MRAIFSSGTGLM